MRLEKKSLVEEITSYLNKSDYCIFAQFDRVTVSEVAHLRKKLKAESAEYHVVKNALLKEAIVQLGYEPQELLFSGSTAIITGGNNVSGVAKVLQQFAKEKEKLPFKGAFISKRALSADEVNQLAQLPAKEILLSQLLSLFNTPATQCVRLLNAVPQSFLTLLQARGQAL